MEKNNIKKTYEESDSFLRGELKRIDTQIKTYNYDSNIGRIAKLWELKKDIVNEIGVETFEEWVNFLKRELERIDTQIKAYNYGDKLKKIVRLWEFRKDIVNKIAAVFYKKEVNFLKRELERIDTQIKAYNYGDTYEVVDKVDKIIELFKLRKIIMEEIKKITEAKGPQMLWI